MKTNHACGTNIIVKDKSQIDIDEINKRLTKWLKNNYADASGEMQYYNIKPQILVEDYLEDNNKESNIVDYQFWCFDGKVNLINSHLYFKGTSDVLCRFFYTTDFAIKYRDNPDYSGPEIVKPRSLKSMIELASQLSVGFPFVRVDFYDIDGKPVFGEMTLTPSGGNNEYLSEEDQIQMGDLINLKLLNSMKVLL